MDLVCEWGGASFWGVERVVIALMGRAGVNRAHGGVMRGLLGVLRLWPVGGRGGLAFLVGARCSPHGDGVHLHIGGDLGMTPDLISITVLSTKFTFLTGRVGCVKNELIATVKKDSNVKNFTFFKIFFT